MRYVIQPLTDFTIFTTAAGDRRPNPFSSPYAATLRLLRDEVEQLGADEIMIDVACTAGDLRRDGALRAHARVTHPGVRVSFESDHGLLTYATDAFAGRWSNDPPDWQINLRAIALGLEALRKVDRYGIAKRGEQYAGYKALPAGRAMPASHMTADEAWSILGSFADQPISVVRKASDPAVVTALHKKARVFAHPDRHDGDQTLWDQVEEAAAVLGARP